MTEGLALGAPALRLRLPAVLSREPIDPTTALGRLFAPDTAVPVRRGAAPSAAARQLGPLAPALRLLPRRERERAETLAAWGAALFATAREGDRAERRLVRLHRSAYLVARALAGDPVPAAFARRLAAESARRTLPRAALDALLATARREIETPIGSTPADWEARTRELAAAIAEAMLGAPPTAPTVDAAAGLLRLARLLGVPAELAARRFHLPIEAPPSADGLPDATALATAVTEECEAIHPLLLRGARGVGEVPLTFRRGLAAALALGLRLLGRLEAHPGDLAVRAPRLGRLAAAWLLWQIRREPLA